MHGNPADHRGDNGDKHHSVRRMPTRDALTDATDEVE